MNLCMYVVHIYIFSVFHVYIHIQCFFMFIFYLCVLFDCLFIALKMYIYIALHICAIYNII